jgi:acetate kinase
MSERMILTFNPGSSTIKFGAFAVAPDRPRRLGSGMIDLRHAPLTLRIVEGSEVSEAPLASGASDDLRDLLDEALARLTERFSPTGVAAVGHRVVHGGDRFSGPVAIDDGVLADIETLMPLAPLHQPHSIRLIKALRRLMPDLLQSASFDTAFHRTQSDLVRRFALPRALFDDGVKRYGFHGLSYRHIARHLAQIAPDIAAGRVVAAHLGSGASLCAMQGGVSRDTSMGFSTLDGIPMATRCGVLDPGVVLHLLKERGMSIEAVEDLLYHRSGLLGVSGISADCRDLVESDAPEAKEAIALFAFRISREIVALANTLGGLDGIIFTGGIGEHQPQIRDAVCRSLAWLGVEMDTHANAAQATRIHASSSKVGVFIISADEEQVIADETFAVLMATGRAQ